MLALRCCSAIILLAVLTLFENPLSGAISTYDNEVEFLNAYDTSDWVDVWEETDWGVTIEYDLFEIHEYSDRARLRTANIADTIIARDLVVDGMEYSNMDYYFYNPIDTFGMSVHNYSTSSYPDPSIFAINLFLNGNPVGSTGFTSPTQGLIFFGFYSSAPFDMFELREVSGGPQNETPTGGAADREFLGRFYIGANSVPEPATWALLILGSWGLLHRKRIRR